MNLKKYIIAFQINLYNHVMKELIEKRNAEFEAFSNESNQQLEKGNKAAGTRAKRSALELSSGTDSSTCSFQGTDVSSQIIGKNFVVEIIFWQSSSRFGIHSQGHSV